MRCRHTGDVRRPAVQRVAGKLLAATVRLHADERAWLSQILGALPFSLADLGAGACRTILLACRDVRGGVEVWPVYDTWIRGTPLATDRVVVSHVLWVLCAARQAQHVVNVVGDALRDGVALCDFACTAALVLLAGDGAHADVLARLHASAAARGTYVYHEAHECTIRALCKAQRVQEAGRALARGEGLSASTSE